MKQEDGITKKFRIHPTTQLEVTVTRGFYTLQDVLEGKWDDEQDTFSFDQAAEDLIDSFNEHDCVAFLEALHRVTAKRIVKHWRDYSPGRLEEDMYKKYLDYETLTEIDKVYTRYSIIAGMTGQVETLTKEQFIHKVKTDVEFSKKWQIEIKERELSLDERRSMVTQEMFDQIYTGGDPSSLSHSEIDQWNLPRTLITVKYK